MDPRNELLMLLSAYRDGELTPAEKARVEQALAQDPSLALRLSDWNALSGGVQATLQQAGDGLDDAAFLKGLQAKLPVAPSLSFGTRLSIWWSEMVQFRPLSLASGFAAAAVLVLGGSYLGAQALSGGGAVPVAPNAPLIAEAPKAPPPAPQPLGGGATAVASRTPKASTVREVKPHPDHDAIVFENHAGASVIFLRPTRK